MRAACFCGALWECELELACCPACGAPAMLPKLVPPRVREDMEAELRLILEDPSNAISKESS